jgi:hypothetical protein
MEIGPGSRGLSRNGGQRRLTFPELCRYRNDGILA